MSGPVLETPRLILRPPQQADADGFALMCAEAETMRFLGGALPSPGAWRQMAALSGSWSLLGYGMFSVIEKAGGRWIGRVGPWQPGGDAGEWPGREVGWGLIAAAQGQGYAYEAAQAAIDWAFDQLGWDDVIHCIDPANAPSIKLAERLGSRRLRQDRLPPPIDMPTEIYGQTAAAWRARPR